MNLYKVSLRKLDVNRKVIRKVYIAATRLADVNSIVVKLSDESPWKLNTWSIVDIKVLGEVFMDGQP